MACSLGPSGLGGEIVPCRDAIALPGSGPGCGEDNHRGLVEPLGVVCGRLGGHHDPVIAEDLVEIDRIFEVDDLRSRRGERSGGFVECAITAGSARRSKKPRNRPSRGGPFVERGPGSDVVQTSCRPIAADRVEA